MLVHPVVGPVAYRMAAYPITPIELSSVDGSPLDPDLKKLWETILVDNLNVEIHQISLGLDYHGFGNSVNSVRVPFRKFLVCKGCGKQFELGSLRPNQYDFSNWTFSLTCPGCGVKGKADQEDIYVRSVSKTRLKRWPLSQIDIEYYPMSGDCEYYYTPSKEVRAQLERKDPKALAETPKEVFEALLKGVSVHLSRDNLFHLRPPGIVLDDPMMGWGVPPILPTLKDNYLQQVLAKSNEVLAQEFIVPWRWISPTSSGSMDVYRNANLVQWMRKVEEELQQYKGDPARVTIFPMPVQFQQMGGQGKLLMPTAELLEYRKMTSQAMGAPDVMLTSEMRWSSSSVALRMLENIFTTYRLQQHRMLNIWLIPILSRIFRLPPVKATMSKFRMGDDVQGKQLLLQLKQLGLISDQRLLHEFDIDAEEEQRIIARENRLKVQVQAEKAMAEARVSGDLNMQSMRDQRRLQAVQGGSPQGLEQPPQQAPQQQLPKSSPGAPPAPTPSVDMRPLPEQKPPRRGGGTGMA
jgi:hypothetical protein